MPATRRRSPSAGSILVPKISVPIARRDWLKTRDAAAILGCSERTLRRRLEQDFWIEGIHWRWVTARKRATLEINFPAAVRLMNTRGWV